MSQDYPAVSNAVLHVKRTHVRMVWLVPPARIAPQNSATPKHASRRSQMEANVLQTNYAAVDIVRKSRVIFVYVRVLTTPNVDWMTTAKVITVP